MKLENRPVREAAEHAGSELGTAEHTVRVALQQYAQQLGTELTLPPAHRVWQRAEQADRQRKLALAAVWVRALQAATAVYAIVAVGIGLYFWNRWTGSGMTAQPEAHAVAGWGASFPGAWWAVLLAMLVAAAAVLVREGRAAASDSL